MIDVLSHVQVQIYITIQVKHEVMYIIHDLAPNISTKKCINAGNKKHAHFRNALFLYYNLQYKLRERPSLNKMNFFQLSKILADHDRCIEWCKENNLLAQSLKCPRAGCHNALSWTRRASSRDGYEWRCSKRGCNGAASMRQKSWFSGSRLSIEKILALTYAWAHKFTTTQAVHETTLDDETTSTETVIDWYNYCREVCADRIMNHHAGPIGGPGTTVEIDESKFGKMKYHRGRQIEGKWVFGGLCRESKACFLVPVERRDKETLLPIIRAQILPGTRVMSDLWRSYDCLKDEGYEHLTVNHSLNFVDPNTGAHTRGIENTWWGVKRSYPRTGTSKELFESYLQEFMWRKHYGENPFGNILKHIATLYNVGNDTRS